MNIQTYEDMFSDVKQKNEGAFIPFIVAGDPDFETSIEIVKVFVENGADAIEIGFPFSDPVADGPTVQLADLRALESGMTVKKGFEFIKRIREFSDIPIGVLTYYNLIYKMGVKEFYSKANKSGVNAVLAADLPPEEAYIPLKESKLNNVEQIFMVSQNTNNERLHKINGTCSGFLYVVSVMGITGTRKELKDTSVNLIKHVKSKSNLPICVGFGISKPEHVREVIKAGADGAIVASAILNLITENLENKQIMLQKIANFCGQLKDATKNLR